MSQFQTDQPVPPGSVGSRQFVSGITDEMRQEARDRLFGVTKQQLLDAANRYCTSINSRREVVIYLQKNVH